MKKSSGAKFSIAAVMGVIALVAGVGYYIIHRSQAVGADISGDGVVGIADLSILATNYGKTAQTYASGDITGDGMVGIADLSMLATAWGTTAPTCTGVAMTQGQADIDAHPAGTTYCISGTHNWTLIPKTGDKIMGNPSNPGVLDGQNTNTWAIYVFNRDVDNVEVANLEIRNYRVEGQRGAILSSNNGESSGWILRNLQVHDNGTSAGGAGASLGPGWQVLGGRYYNNRQSGLARGDSGVVVDGVELDHNNFTDNSYTTATIDCGFEGGGFKWAALSGVVIKNSRIHHNACRGLWADGSGNNSTITNNQIFNNWNEGIMIEISTGSTITGNTIYGNGFGGCSAFGWGAGIIIPASNNVTIANNTIYGNCNGIIGLQQSRPDGNPGLLQDLIVRDNSIAGPGGKTGAVTDNGTNLTTRNLQFINNTYSNGMNFCNLNC